MIKKILTLNLLLFVTYLSPAFAQTIDRIDKCPAGANGTYTYINDPNDGGCVIPAESYSFTLYRVGLCTAFTLPENPSIGSSVTGSPKITTYDQSAPTAVLGSNCVTIFSNTSGSSVSIRSAGKTEISGGGTLTIPPRDKTYAYAFAVIGKTLSYSASVTFDSPQAPNTTFSVGSGSGPKCWTTARTFTTSTIIPEIMATPPNRANVPVIRCGPTTSTDTPGTIQQITDCAEPDSDGNNGCFYNRDSSDAASPVGIWLTNDDLRMVLPSTTPADLDRARGPFNDVTRLVLVTKLATPISGDIQEVNIRFATTEAINITSGNANNTTNATFATSGNFKFSVTTTQ